jgi:deoxyribonuclease V
MRPGADARRLVNMAGADQPSYAAVDVHYPPEGGARAAVVTAWEPRFAAIAEQRVRWLASVAPYQPGRFYTRELPPLQAVLADLGHPLLLVIIDGYVDLDPRGRPGLGAHLHAHLRVPVIGVAKTAFRTASHAVPVRRGDARRPLYVTSAGVPADRAAALVAAMAGPYRLPDALRRVDALARSENEDTPESGWQSTRSRDTGSSSARD